MNWKDKKWIINTVIFVCVFVMLFVQASYLLRPNSVNRKNIIGFYNEEPNSIDVVFIGGSSTYVFWAPYVAWNDVGMVSYDFSTDSMSPALLKGLMIEAEKTQSPKLYVIDLRALEVRESHPEFYAEGYIRNITDSLKYSNNRAQMIDYAYEVELGEREFDVAKYVDFCMYHSNWQSLTEESFKYASNDYPSEFKGFAMVPHTYHQAFEKNDYSYVTARKELSEETNQVLIDLLDYCKESGLNVLFTLNPIYMENSSVKEIYNYVGDIVESYGYDFLNSNDYYEEMEIDFSRDFYNRDHVNLYGAEKYTKFLEDYIIQNYDIPDRRDDLNYDSWHDGYDEWCVAVDAQKTLIDAAIGY